MADQESWRSQRAAQLAGSPFAKPARDAALDATMPLAPFASPSRPAAPIATAPISTVTASRMSESLAAMTRLGTVATVLLVLGLALWVWLRSRTAVPVTALLPTISAAVPAASARVSAPLRDIAPVSPGAQLVPPLPPIANVQHSLAAHDDRPAKPMRGAKKDDRHRIDAGKHPRARHSEPQRRADDRATPAAVVAPHTAKPLPLPVCQPTTVNRPPRPCRPSHERFVREPFYSN